MFYPFDAPQLDQTILVLNVVLLCKSWVWDSGMLGSCAIEISVIARSHYCAVCHEKRDYHELYDYVQVIKHTPSQATGPMSDPD